MSEYVSLDFRRWQMKYSKCCDIITGAESGAGLTVGAVQRGSPDRLPVILSICRERNTSNGMPDLSGMECSLLCYDTKVPGTDYGGIRSSGSPGCVGISSRLRLWNHKLVELFIDCRFDHLMTTFIPSLDTQCRVFSSS